MDPLFYRSTKIRQKKPFLSFIPGSLTVQSDRDRNRCYWGDGLIQIFFGLRIFIGKINFATTSRILRILMEHIVIKNSLDFKLQTLYIYVSLEFSVF